MDAVEADLLRLQPPAAECGLQLREGVVHEGRAGAAGHDGLDQHCLVGPLAAGEEDPSRTRLHPKSGVKGPCRAKRRDSV